MHLLLISALFTPAKVRVLPPVDRGKSLELRELNRVVADELINEADGTVCVFKLILILQRDLARSRWIPSPRVLILSSVWSAANLDNLVCGYHWRPHSR